MLSPHYLSVSVGHLSNPLLLGLIQALFLEKAGPLPVWVTFRKVWQCAHLSTNGIHSILSTVGEHSHGWHFQLIHVETGTLKFSCYYTLALREMPCLSIHFKVLRALNPPDGSQAVCDDGKERQGVGREMAQWVKVPAANPNNLTLVPKNPHGKRRKQTAVKLPPDLHNTLLSLHL